MRVAKNIARWGALALVVGLGVACEPPPPRTTLVVDDTGTAPDTTPGDGVCTTSTGTCTLSAAIDEANALGAAAVTLPAGAYDVAGETVTGTIWINDRDPNLGVSLTGLVTVAPGGTLLLDGALALATSGAAPPEWPLHFRVDGSLVLRNVQVGWAGTEETLVHVGPTGSALIDTSFLSTVLATSSLVVNEGQLWLRHSWLLNMIPNNDDTFALLTLGEGVSTTGTSAIAPQGVGDFPSLPGPGCGGVPPVSAGYNAVGDDTCGLDGEGDRVSSPPLSTGTPAGGFDYEIAPDSPLVDAIPIGVHGCGSEPWGDWYGQPRPADGDGDGELACDIGPKELQPPGQPAPFADGPTTSAADLWDLDGGR